MGLISDRFNFAFVRVPRTGSTTYCHYLEGTFGPYLRRVGVQHASALAMRQELGEKKWSTLRTYGFIRNPWAWLVSLYDSGVSATPGEQEVWQGDILDHTTRERMNFTFAEFIKQRRTTPIDWLVDEAGNVLVDEVMRFEDFTDNWKVRASRTPGAIVTDRMYQSWYSPGLVDLVAEKCEREIALGRYEFVPL